MSNRVKASSRESERKEETAVKIRCAWCEQEGRPALISDLDSQAYLDSQTYNAAMPESHGICMGHKLLFIHMLESSPLMVDYHSP